MDKYELNDLRDLTMPEAPSWYPMAPGLVFLLVVVAWLGLCFGIAYWRSYRVKAYRRAGVALLAEARTTRELSVVLKRVALVSYEREVVASLYGDEWVDFLEGSCSGVVLSELVATGNEPSQELRTQAERWIKNHRIC